MWQEEDNQLYKKFQFADFTQAFKFMELVAQAAEEQRHHPRWENNWNKVQIWLSTHDAGSKVTEKDHKLAGAIDEAYERVKQSAGDIKKTNPSLGGSGKRLKIKLYADGGSRGNPGPSASGYVLYDMGDNILAKEGAYLGITTNNQAEYQALKIGIEQALHLGAAEVEVYMDSLLVINQMKGSFKVKNRDLWPIYEAIKNLCKAFKKVSFTHVPRELNRAADEQVNISLDANT